MKSGLEGRTLVLVTHRPVQLKLVDRLIVIDNGRVIADGPKEQIRKAVSKPLDNAQQVA